jgi:hypothetical protein
MKSITVYDRVDGISVAKYCLTTAVCPRQRPTVKKSLTAQVLEQDRRVGRKRHG